MPAAARCASRAGFKVPSRGPVTGTYRSGSSRSQFAPAAVMVRQAAGGTRFPLRSSDAPTIRTYGRQTLSIHPGASPWNR